VRINRHQTWYDKRKKLKEGFTLNEREKEEEDEKEEEEGGEGVEEEEEEEEEEEGGDWSMNSGPTS
jgi:hypothetical protein